MKKVFKICALSLALVLTVPSVKAQLFDEGNMVISAGLGFGNTVYALGSLYSTSVPIIWAAGDYCLREDLGPGNLGVGAVLGYTQYKYDWVTDVYRTSTFFFGARGTYHFTDLVDKLDLYGGITLGGKISSDNYKGNDVLYDGLGSGLLSEVFAGARYFFTDDIAAMAELGYGIAALKIGISFKF